MLTKSHQRLLVTMLARDISRRDNEIFKSKAYYRAIHYLEENRFVKKYPIKHSDKEYRLGLTIKGILMAKILSGLSDMPEETRNSNPW